MGRIIVKAARVATLRLELLVALPGDGGGGRRRSHRGREVGVARRPGFAVVPARPNVLARAFNGALRGGERAVGAGSYDRSHY